MLPLRIFLSLPLLSPIFLPPIFLPSTSFSENLQSDPFITQQLNRTHWEPAGKHWPQKFWNRGTISQRGGQVIVLPTSAQRVGNLSLQTGIIHGRYTYTIDLKAYHPWQVHSPFDSGHTDSAVASETVEGKSGARLKLNWNGQMHHGVDAYDGAQGHGFPPPKGARDDFAFDIRGTANGLYRLSPQDRQRTDPPPATHATRPSQRAMGTHFSSAPHPSSRHPRRSRRRSQSAVLRRLAANNRPTITLRSQNVLPTGAPGVRPSAEVFSGLRIRGHVDLASFAADRTTGAGSVRPASRPTGVFRSDTANLMTRHAWLPSR